MIESTTISIESTKRPLFMDWTYQHSANPPWTGLADLKLFVSGDSDLYEPLMATIRKAGLSEFSSSIAAVAREAVRIESTVPDDYSELRVSRLGGFPDLPDASLFPTTEGRFWIFLAQINMADMAPLNGFLPRSGLLSFFVDSTTGLTAKVLFHEEDSGSLITVRHGGGSEMIDPDDDYTQGPHRVKFSRFTSLPYDPPDPIVANKVESLYQECDSLHSRVDHHLNGYTFTQHESPQEQAADKLGGRPEEWVQLLSLGWDDKVGFCFWDAGTLTFSIHQEDLRRWDFSKVYCSLETS
jgi:uncharacterized protein YwqG